MSSIESASQVKERLQERLKHKDQKVSLVDPESYVLWENCTLKIFLKSPELEKLLKTPKIIEPASKSFGSNLGWMLKERNEIGEIFTHKGYDVAIANDYFGNKWGAQPALEMYGQINPYILATVGLSEGILFTAPCFLENINQDPAEAMKLLVDSLYSSIKKIYQRHNKTIFATLSFSVNLLET